MENLGHLGGREVRYTYIKTISINIVTQTILSNLSEIAKRAGWFSIGMLIPVVCMERENQKIETFMKAL